MAFSLNDISAITTQKIVPVAVDVFFKDAPLFVLMRKNRSEQFAGGTFIQQPIEYQRLNGGAFARGGTFDTSYQQTTQALQFNVKFYYVNVTLMGTDRVLNQGAEAVMSNMSTKMANAAQTLAYFMGTDMFLDGQGNLSSTLQLDGLFAACNDGQTSGSGTGETAIASYGGLARSAIGTGANNGINGYTQSFAGKSVGMSDLNAAIGAATFGQSGPNIMVGTQAVWNVFWNKIQPQQRFLDKDSAVAMAGFKSVRVDGIPMVVDQYAAAGVLYGLDSSFLKLWISEDPAFHFGFTGFKEAVNTVDVSGQYLFGGNMIYSNPRVSFQLLDITK